MRYSQMSVNDDDAVLKGSVSGVESIDDVGFNPPARGDIEAVLASPVPDHFQLFG